MHTENCNCCQGRFPCDGTPVTRTKKPASPWVLVTIAHIIAGAAIWLLFSL